MRTLMIILCATFIALVPLAPRAEQRGLSVKAVRYFSYAGFTRIVFDIEAAAPYVVAKTENGRTVTLRAYEGGMAVRSPLPAIRDGVVGGMELRDEGGRPFIAISLETAAGEVKDFVLRNPDRIVIDVMRGTAPPPVPAPGSAQTVVVIDPGHGGPRDTGVVTVRGAEKITTLEWSDVLKKTLTKDPALLPVLTREKDQALSLDDRAGASNTAGAAVFVSIHAAAGNGLRVFILDPDDEPDQRGPAIRPDFLGFEAESERQERLWQRQQAAHIQESGILGRMIAKELGGAGSPEPLQAPLAGLKAVDAAAILVEIGMDARADKAMEAIARGIERYVREKR